jgi:hypothetical protein
MPAGLELQRHANAACSCPRHTSSSCCAAALPPLCCCRRPAGAQPKALGLPRPGAPARPPATAAACSGRSELLQRLPHMSARFLGQREALAAGERAALTGLLEDVHSLHGRAGGAAGCQAGRPRCSGRQASGRPGARPVHPAAAAASGAACRAPRRRRPQRTAWSACRPAGRRAAWRCLPSSSAAGVAGRLPQGGA